MRNTDSLFCNGATVMANGNVAVVGGHIAKSGYVDGLRSLRVFDRCAPGGAGWPVEYRYAQGHATPQCSPCAAFQASYSHRPAHPPIHAPAHTSSLPPSLPPIPLPPPHRQANTLLTLTNMTFPRWYPSANLLPDGRILVMGGTTRPGAGTPNNPTCEVWDPQHAPLAPTVQWALPGSFVSKAGDIFYP